MAKSIPYLILSLGLIFLVSCLPRDEAVSAPTVTIPPDSLPRKGPASVEVVEIHQLETFPVAVNVRARGHLPDDCTTIDQISQARTGMNFQISIETIHYNDQVCPPEQIPFEESIELDVANLPAGTYVVDVNGLQGTFTLRADNVPDQENAVIGGRVWLDSCEIIRDVEGSAAEAVSECEIDDDGKYVANGRFDPDEGGLAGIKLDLGEGSCPAAGLAATISDEEGAFLFSGLKGGTYCVSIDRFDPQNTGTLISGRWTFPDLGEDVATTVNLASGESNLELFFGWYFPAIEPYVPPPEECTDKAIFLDDVTIPDNTSILVGETFTKTWKLQNIGSCTWDIGYEVIFADGDRFGASEAISLTQTVEPGDEIDISVPMVAPLETGEYRGEWKLRNPDGFLFGIGPGSDRAFWVQINVEE